MCEWLNKWLDVKQARSEAEKKEERDFLSH